jgi:hypothetical protein
MEISKWMQRLKWLASPLIGMGSSPGAQYSGKVCRRQSFDETEAVDIFHAAGAH